MNQMTEILVILIILFGAFIRTVFGFGDALAAMPLLALIAFDTQSATALIGITSLCVAIPATIEYRHDINWKVIVHLVLGSVLGIPMGIALVKFSSTQTIARVLGIFLIIYGAYNLIKVFRGKATHLRLHSPWFDYLFGWISGVLGSAYNSHGVAVAVYGTLKNWTAKEFRGILQAHFTFTGIIVVSSQLASGFWNLEVLKLFLISLPLLVIVIWLSNLVSAKINTATLVKYVYGMLFLFGIMLLIKA